MSELIQSYAQALLDGAEGAVPVDVAATADRRIRRGLAALPEIEANVLVAFYGVDQRPLSADAIASRLDLERGEVERLRERGLARLGCFLAPAFEEAA